MKRNNIRIKIRVKLMRKTRSLYYMILNKQ